MFSLDITLNCLKSAGVKPRILLVFNNNIFSHSAYIFINDKALPHTSFKQLHSMLDSSSLELDKSPFTVRSVVCWTKETSEFRYTLQAGKFLSQLSAFPVDSKAKFQKMDSLINFDNAYTIIKINFENNKSEPFIDLASKCQLLEKYGFDIINHTSKGSRRSSFSSPGFQLNIIKKDRLMIETLINEKLELTRGSLTGIRQSYADANVNISLVSLMYGFESIDELERKVKAQKNINQKASEAKVAIEQPSSTLIKNVELKTERVLKKVTLLSELVVPETCVTPIKVLEEIFKRPLKVEDILGLESFSLQYRKEFTPSSITAILQFKRTLERAFMGFGSQESLFKKVDINKPKFSINEPSKPTLNENNVPLSTSINEVDLNAKYNAIKYRLYKTFKRHLSIKEVLGLLGASLTKYSGFTKAQANELGELQHELKTSPLTLIKKNAVKSAEKVAPSNTEKNTKKPKSRSYSLSDLYALKPQNLHRLDWEKLITKSQLKYSKEQQYEFLKCQVDSFEELTELSAKSTISLTSIVKQAEKRYPCDFVKQLELIKGKEAKTNNDAQRETASASKFDEDKLRNAHDQPKPTEHCEVVESCHFVKFTEKNEIGIEVRDIKSFDAFDFESINNKLIVIINSSHAFYDRLYKDASEDSRKVLDMMIASLCHLSHLNISEKAKEQDRRLFSRWSEYIEDYLLGE